MKVIVYTKTDPICPYCQMAKQYLVDHDIVYEEIVFNDDHDRHAMFDRLGLQGDRRTVPQIIVVAATGQHTRIGGYQDLIHSDLAAQVAVGEFTEDF